MKIKKEDVAKAFSNGAKLAIDLAEENIDSITGEINRVIEQDDKIKIKYAVKLEAVFEIDTDSMNVIAYGKFKAPRADMADESTDVVFPIDDPNQIPLPFGSDDD